MRKKTEEIKNLKIVDEFQTMPNVEAAEASGILEKVQFIGENYNFVQKEIQDIIARSKANDSKIKQYRDSINELESQLKKERQYTVKLVDEYQELRAGHYQVEEQLHEAVETQSTLQLNEKNLILELKKQKQISENNQARAEQAFHQARKLHKMVYSSEEQTQSLKSQLQGLRSKWVEEKKSWSQSHAKLNQTKQQIQNEYLKIEKSLQKALEENNKISVENRKAQEALKSETDAMRKLESQLDHRQALIESRDRRIKLLEAEITDLHKNREQQLKQRTGQLYDQVENLKKICQRLRAELKGKQNEMDELTEKWKTYERIHRSEPEKKLAALKKNNDDLNQRLVEKSNALQKFQNLDFQNQENIKSKDRLVEEVDFLKDQLEESHAHTENAKRALNEAVMQRHEVEQELKHLKLRTVELQQDNSKLNQGVESLQKNLTEKSALVEKVKESHQARMRELSSNFEKDKETLREELNETKVEVKQLRLEANYLNENRAKLSKENDGYFEKVNQLKGDIDTIKAEHTTEVRQWLEKVSQLESEKQRLSNELVKVEARVINVQGLMSEDQSRSQNLQAEFDRKVAELNQELFIFQKDKKNLHSHRQSIAAEKNLLEERLDNLQRRYAEDVDRFENDHFQLQQKLDGLMTDQADLQEKLLVKENELSSVRERLREEEHQSSFNKKESDLIHKQLSDQILSIQENWAKEKQILVEKYKSERVEIEKRLISEKNQLIKLQAVERTSLENQWNQERQGHKVELEKLSKQHADERASLKSQWAQDKQAFKVEMEQLIKQQADKQVSLENQWNQERQGHKVELENLIKQHADERVSLKSQWAQEKQAFKVEMEQLIKQQADKQASLENQWNQERQGHIVELENLIKQHADERASLEEEWAQEKQAIIVDMEQLIKQQADKQALLENQWTEERQKLIAEKESLDKRWMEERTNQISQWTHEREILVADKVRETSDLREANDELRKDLDDLRLMTEQSSAEKQRSFDEEKQRLQDEMTRLQHLNMDLKKEKKFESEYEDRLKNQYSQSQEKLEELRSRETQISNYSRLVDEQKFKLRRFADELASEVTGLQVLNPLREYLELTKREIRNVELQLSKTPALAIERKPLEEHFEKLVCQRDQLQKSLDESKQALHKKAKAVKEICRRAVLIPLPPLPPKESNSSGSSS